MDIFTSEQLKTLIYILSKEHKEKMSFQGFIALHGDMNLKFASNSNVRVVSFSEGRDIINKHVEKALNNEF